MEYQLGKLSNPNTHTIGARLSKTRRVVVHKNAHSLSLNWLMLMHFRYLWLKKLLKSQMLYLLYPISAQKCFNQRKRHEHISRIYLIFGIHHPEKSILQFVRAQLVNQSLFVFIDGARSASHKVHTHMYSLRANMCRHTLIMIKKACSLHTVNLQTFCLPYKMHAFWDFVLFFLLSFAQCEGIIHHTN